MPDATFHSVIDSPLSVRRVIPPTRTMTTTIAATISNQRAIANGRTRLCDAEECESAVREVITMMRV